jgi:uncharacterized protein
MAADLAGFQWLNPPAEWTTDGDRLTLLTHAGTDFWQRTHYGFRRDDGHFLFTRRTGDFIAEATVSLTPNARYDQAGLMVRLSPSGWLKTSCEFQPDGPSALGAVVTNSGFSDWSYRPVSPFPAEVRLRIERHGGDYLVAAGLEGSAMDVHRVARLLEDDGRGEILVGVYACSPDGPGCPVAISEVAITPRPAKPGEGGAQSEALGG